MVQVEHDALEVDFNAGFARLCVKHLDVYDDHDLANSLTQGLGLPAGAAGPTAIPGVAPVRATVSFDFELKEISTMAKINNSTQYFKGSFPSTGATIKWSADEPGFHFESETPDPSRNLVSVLGREQNGVFFT